MRDRGWNLDTHETVSPVGRVVDRSQDISGSLNVCGGELDIQGIRVSHTRGQERLELLVVVGAVADRLGKNRRVAGQPGDMSFIDQSLELTAGEQTSADVVKPDALTSCGQLAKCGP